MEKIEDTVHEETQRADEGFDLTVASVYVVERAGRVDFGGGELEDAKLSRLRRRNSTKTTTTDGGTSTPGRTLSNTTSL